MAILYYARSVRFYERLKIQPINAPKLVAMNGFVCCGFLLIPLTGLYNPNPAMTFALARFWRRFLGSANVWEVLYGLKTEFSRLASDNAI